MQEKPRGCGGSRKQQVGGSRNREKAEAKNDPFKKKNWLQVSNTHPYLSTGLAQVTIEATEHCG